MDSVKRFYVLIIWLAILAAGCSYSSRDEKLPGQNEEVRSPVESEKPAWAEMKLYFRNNNYHEEDPESTPVISVTRLVSPDELTARAVLEALISGPSPGEQFQHGAGPVINESGLIIEDVYIKNDICVVLLQSSHPLPLYNYDRQPPAQAEAVLVQSLLHSLAGLPPVDAVWLFHNGSPWQGNTVDWLCPLALPGSGVGYTLYFSLDGTTYHSRGLEYLTPVQIKLDSSGYEGAADCPFAKIIELLSKDYDPAHRAALPRDIQVRGFTLTDHQLIIDLSAPFTGSPEEARAFVGALVYTFTGLPEIDEVMVTVEGQTWESGGIAWSHPLSREDLKRDMNMNMSVNRPGGMS